MLWWYLVWGVAVRAAVLEVEAKVGGSRGDGEGWY